MNFEYPPRLGWCTKHNSTTICKDCEIDELRAANKRYREALEQIAKGETDCCYEHLCSHVARCALEG